MSLRLIFTFIPLAVISVATKKVDVMVVVDFTVTIPLAVIAVATCEKELTWEVETEVTIPLAVIAVATADLENPCPERLSKLDLANQMNFCRNFHKNSSFLHSFCFSNL